MKSHHVPTLLILPALVLCFVPRPALADTSNTTPVIEPSDDEPSPAGRRRWYGWQTLLIDGVSIGLVIGAVSTAGPFISFSGRDKDQTLSTSLAVMSLGTYVLGAPTVHGLHGHGLKALGSLAMRIGGPAAIGLLGWGFGTGIEKILDRLGVADAGAGIGVFAGFVTPIVLDAAWLAEEVIPPESVARRSPSHGDIGISNVVPLFDVQQRSIDVSGRF